MDTLKESALEADSGRKIPCMTTDSNLPFLSDALPAELSYPHPLQTSISIILKMRASVFSMAGAATSIVFVVTKHVFCHDKNMLVATNMCFCHNKSMLAATKKHAATEPCLSRQIFVATKVFVMPKIFLSRQTFCRNKDKHTSVATKDVLCRDKRTFVATEIILVAATANDTV